MAEIEFSDCLNYLALAKFEFGDRSNNLVIAEIEFCNGLNHAVVANKINNFDTDTASYGEATGHNECCMTFFL